MWACVVYKWLCGVGCHHIVLESTRDRGVCMSLPRSLSLQSTSSITTATPFHGRVIPQQQQPSIRSQAVYSPVKHFESNIQVSDPHTLPHIHNQGPAVLSTENTDICYNSTCQHMWKIVHHLTGYSGLLLMVLTGCYTPTTVCEMRVRVPLF